MNAHEKNYLLLMFGSVGCGICNEKTKDLAQNYEGKHELLIHKDERRFDLIGINTDSGAARKRFDKVMLNDDDRSEAGYDFIKWADSRGETLSTFFLERGESFGVPFTALLTTKGMLWRASNKESFSVERLLAITQAKIDGDATPVDPKPEKPPGGEIELSFDPIIFATPERLDKVKIANCQGSETTTLQGQLPGADVTFIQVDVNDCAVGSVCRQNLQEFNRFVDECRFGDNPSMPRCGFATLVSERVTNDLCGLRTAVYRGGRDVIDAFTTHFNWAYDPILRPDQSPMAVQEFKGPMILGFRSNGRLVYSHEGGLPADGQPNALRGFLEGGAEGRPKGADFPIYGERRFSNGPRSQNEPVGLTFSQITEGAKYTIVASIERFCGSCIDELAHWSGTSSLKQVLGGNLVDFCEASGVCQVFALEAELAQPNTASGRLRFFNEIKDRFFTPRDVRIPLLLDTRPIGDGYASLFDGYFTQLFPNWDGVYGTVIYDYEGKIIANFKSGSITGADPVFETLKALEALEESHRMKL